MPVRRETSFRVPVPSIIPICALVTKNTQPDVLIMGAGVIGLSLAWELANRDQRVLLVDSGQAGQASWAGAGILPAAATTGIRDPYESLKALSHQLHAQWSERLRAATGIDTEYNRCGGLHVARSPAEAATLAANEFWWQEHGIRSQLLEPAELKALEPHLKADFRAAWRLPDECQLRNPRHLRALSVACQKMGVQLREDDAVVKLLTDGKRVTGWLTAQGAVLTADNYCICSGAWARQSLDELKIPNGILPVRGQMVLFRGPRPLLGQIVNEGNRYLVPRRDGRLLAGSVEEEVGYVCETTDIALQGIQDWATELLPALKQCSVEKTWAGLRPGSFDGLPYLGLVPTTENLFLAAGHFRSGLHLSCGTAVVMADMIEGRPDRFDVTPFRVGRG